MGVRSTINFKITKDPKAPIEVKSLGEQAAEYKAMIEAYKIQNPVKYALKEKSLLAKLEKMGGKIETKKEDKKEDNSVE